MEKFLKVSQWLYRPPVEEGTYLICKGEDVNNDPLAIESFMKDKNGKLKTKDGFFAHCFNPSFMFAKINF